VDNEQTALRTGSEQARRDERDAEAAAETAAGVGLPIDDIARWVASWDTDDEQPIPAARRVI
jgi:outer membrane biogenesis lipoprotein LolB